MKKNYLIVLLFTVVACGFYPGDEDKNPAITAQEIIDHITYLASDELAGRFTGTDECYKVAEYIRDDLKTSGLSPLFDSDYFQEFSFIAGIEPGSENSISFSSSGSVKELEMKTDFITAPFSGKVSVKGELVFVGYGISAPKLKYDDYDGIDVTGKIVVAMRYSPEYDNPHSEFDEFASFRHKATIARDKGALGIIFVNGHAPKDEEDVLMKFSYDRGGSIPEFAAVHVKRNFIDELFIADGLVFSDYQKKVTESKKPAPFIYKNSSVELSTEVNEIKKISWNVAGVIEGSDPVLKNEYVVVGAHFDHLGMGETGSLYRGDEPMIHNGADDNASGTSGMMELAEKFASIKNQLKRSMIFVGFSGEELGLLGSAFFVNHLPIESKKIVTMVNLDMIGRLNAENQLIVYGTGTSKTFKDILNSSNKENLNLAFNDEGYGPSDHSSFYGKEIPVLFFFTGTHTDYHRPSDDADKINSTGTKSVVDYVFDVTDKVVNADARPDYVLVPRKDGGTMGGWKVYVGTIPDYASNEQGFRISGVNEGSPAQKGGLMAGDIMTSFGGNKITNIYDYVYALQNFVPGDVVDVVVIRNNEKIELKVELGAR
ncbi:MAG: M28 family peptidase [Ignavibacteriales bacterium]|nr:MAG: M28 family peptidase [Ignavibacteriales bacterium]